MSSFAHKPFPQFGKRNWNTKGLKNGRGRQRPIVVQKKKIPDYAGEKTTFACYSYFLSMRGKTGLGECLHVQMKKLADHQTSFSRIVTHFFTTPLPPICSINKFSARGGVFICGRRRETQIRSGEKINFLLWVFVGEIPSGELRWRPRHLFLLFSSLRPPPYSCLPNKDKIP